MTPLQQDFRRAFRPELKAEGLNSSRSRELSTLPISRCAPPIVWYAFKMFALLDMTRYLSAYEARPYAITPPFSYSDGSEAK